MKIAFVGTAYPMRGGIAQFNALLCRELAREHEIRLLSFTRQYPSVLFPGKTQIESGVDAAPMPASAMVDSLNPITWRRTADAIVHFGADLLLFKYWIPFFAPCFGGIARRVKKRSPCPVVLICDNVIPHERRLFDTALTRYVLRSADGFIVMSEQVLEDLRLFRPEAPVRKVRHPLYTQFGSPIPRVEARARLKIGPEERVLLFFGYIRRYKGLDLLLRAMPEINAATGARLIVLGEFYEDREPYDRLVRDLGIAPFVTMAGDYVPNDAVGVNFSAADLVVLPYRSATQSGIVQVAYQMERPVICTRVGGLEEMVRHGDTGLIVPPEDERALADSVVRYFREGMEPRLMEGIRREKTAMGWDRFAAAVTELGWSLRPGAAAGGNARGRGERE